MPSLVRQGTVPGSNEFTATLFDLIRRGRYKATPVTTERPVWGGLRHEDVADLEVTLGRPEGARRPPFEEPVAKVVDWVVDTEGERLSKFREEIERDRTANSKLLHEVQGGRRPPRSRRAGGTSARAWSGWSSGSACSRSRRSSCSGSASTAGAPPRRAGATSCSSRWAGARPSTPSRCCSARSARPLWRRRSAAGEAEAERWEAFRRYLTDFPRLKEAPPATLELWERYLVYGIAFGIAERVLQGAHLHMPEALHDQSTIYWISPTGDLGSGPSALAIGDLSSGFGSALAPPARAEAAEASPAVAEEAAAGWRRRLVATSGAASRRL